MAVVIKKRVNLDFLGEEYKGSYLEFQALPLKDYGELITELEKVESDKTQSIPFMLQTLKKYFLGGKVQDEEVSADDLDEFDRDTAINCFETLTGTLDPKGDGLSTMPSSTEVQPQPNS